MCGIDISKNNEKYQVLAKNNDTKVRHNEVEILLDNVIRIVLNIMKLSCYLHTRNIIEVFRQFLICGILFKYQKSNHEDLSTLSSRNSWPDFIADRIFNVKMQPSMLFEKSNLKQAGPVLVTSFCTNRSFT